jgi:cell division protein FtsQ
MAKKTIIKNVLLFALWSVIAAGTIVLLVAAIQKKDANKCTGIDINIKGVSNNFFVDKNDILQTIISISGGNPTGKSVGSFDLQEMEAALQKNIWVKTAQLFFDNNEKLQVKVFEREPVARVFTSAGTTFYVDSSSAMLPLSEKFSARLPVFTNFPTDKKVLLKADSNLLRDILTVSLALQADTFSMAMIDQVDITPQRTFEMIPKFGNTIIIFGSGKDAAEKLGKLRLFYKEVMVKAGWNKYSEINVQYKNQLVAKRKGAEEVKADSLLTLQLIQVIAENAARMASDSVQTIVPDNEHNTTNNNIIQQSIERDDNSTTGNAAEAHVENKTPVTTGVAPDTANKPAVTIIKKPAVIINKPVVSKPATPAAKPAAVVVKPAAKPTVTGLKQPKLVMPKPLPKKPGTAKPVNEY